MQRIIVDLGQVLKGPAEAWASSDVLMSIHYDLTPEQLGLVEQEDLPIYTFPLDYIARLWDAIQAVDPVFAEDLESFRARQAADSNEISK